MNRPRTVEELNALPEGPAFGSEERVIDGRIVRVPIAPQTVAIFHDEDDIISWVDAEGVPWSIGLYADGHWFKRRGVPRTVTIKF